MIDKPVPLLVYLFSEHIRRDIKETETHAYLILVFQMRSLDMPLSEAMPHALISCRYTISAIQQTTQDVGLLSYWGEVYSEIGKIGKI